MKESRQTSEKGRSMIRLTLPEIAELHDHFEERTRANVWSKTPSGIWVRLQDGDICMAVTTAYPTKPSPYALGGVQAIAGDLWKDDEASEYLERLVHHWTGYAQRMQVMTLMKDELKTDESTAHALSVAVASFYNGTSVEPEPPAIQDSIPDVRPERLPLNLKDPRPYERSFSLIGGGWVKVNLRGEMFFGELSLPFKEMMGHAHLSGFLRSSNGYGVRTTAEYLFGWEREGVASNDVETQRKLEEAS